MQTPRRYAPVGGSFAPVRVAGFTWNGWQASAVYAADLKFSLALHPLASAIGNSRNKEAALPEPVGEVVWIEGG